MPMLPSVQHWRGFGAGTEGAARGLAPRRKDLMLTTEKTFPLVASDRGRLSMERPAVAAEPDEELVLSAKAGSRPAFEALVRRYQEPVYFLCYRYVRDHDTAAELAQRAFVRAMDSI